MIKISANRALDENGFLRVRRCRIMKAGVNGYYGREIAGWEGLNLEPDRLYQVYRPFGEFAPNADTFNGLPVLNTHCPVDSEELSRDEVKAFQIGSIGTDVTASGDSLVATLIFTDGEAIREILDGEVRELSPGYRYVCVPEKGFYKGAAYSLKMTNIRGNHLTKVAKGRQGPDVVVADEMPPQEKENRTMNIPNLRDILRKVFLPEADLQGPDLLKLDLAASAIEEVLNGPPEETSGDSELCPEKLTAFIDAITDEELRLKLMALLEDITDISLDYAATVPAADFPAGSISGSAAGSASGMTPLKLPREGEPCSAWMRSGRDAAINKDGNWLAELIEAARSEARQEAQKEIAALVNSRARALEDVRPLVGVLDPMSFDSARGVYEYALKQHNIKVKGRNDLSTLRSMAQALIQNHRPVVPSLAMDRSAGRAAELLDQLKRRA